MAWDGKKKDGTGGGGDGAVLSIEPGYLIDIDDTDPQHPIVNYTGRWWNTDTTTAIADDAPVSFLLTHVPINDTPGRSLHIRQNGWDVPAASWSILGRVVTITPGADLIIRAGDGFDAAYSYDAAAAPLAPVPVLLGTNVAVNEITSVDMPPGVVTEPGDLIVAVIACAGLATVSDSRLAAGLVSWGDGAVIAWGYDDGSGDPLAISTTDGIFNYSSVAIAVYRGVQVIAYDTVDTGPAGSNDITLATFTDAQAVLGCLLAFTGIVAGTGIGNDTTGDLTTDLTHGDTKVYTKVTHWADTPPQTSPAGAFHLNGTWAGFAAVTLLLEST